ncbi:MAG: segregation and condensation protein A [Oceanococcus sp.]
MSEKAGTVVAQVAGHAYTELPHDLYIPPDALEVFLDTFEGPLDLLLYLIRRQNLNILDIPVALITQQYLDYIGLMEELRFDLAAEYLVMAAWLAEIKSRMLLPKAPRDDGEDNDDPRAELVRRLQAYAEVQQAAVNLDELPRQHRDTFPAHAQPMEVDAPIPPPPPLRDLLLSLQDLLQRAELLQSHKITSEPLSVRARMSLVLDRMSKIRKGTLMDLWDEEEGRKGLVVSFLAVLELVRNGLLQLEQDGPYATVHLRLAGAGQA